MKEVCPLARNLDLHTTPSHILFLKCSHLTTPNCKDIWEISMQMPRKKVKIGYGEQPAIHKNIFIFYILLYIYIKLYVIIIFIYKNRIILQHILFCNLFFQIYNLSWHIYMLFSYLILYDSYIRLYIQICHNVLTNL